MKSGLHSHYKTNPKAERDGAPLRFPKNEDGTQPTFFVARMGGGNGKKFQATYAEEMAPHKAERDLGILSDEVVEQVSIRVFVKACLRGWENVQTEDGDTIAYSPEAAVQLFTELPELFGQLNMSASLFATYRAANLEAAAKN